MWLRRNCIGLCLVWLAACGFHPMYGDAAMQATHTPLQGNLAIDPIPGRMGQVLKVSLEDIFNPEGIKYAHPDYRLHATVIKTEVPVVIRSDGTVLRSDIRIDSTFSLIEVTTGKTVYSGSLKRFGDYNADLNANFATYEAEQDITERTIQELAQDYLLRLSGYFASVKPDAPLPAAPAPPPPSSAGMPMQRMQMQGGVP